MIEDGKIIAIIRRLYGDTLIRLAEALNEGGIKVIEVTFDQADPECLSKTSEAISRLSRTFGDSMLYGAGTVLNTEQVETARQAGARYIVSPNVSPEVIRLTKSLGLISIPGAMTPSEILHAHDCGADYVKIFPAGELGLPYIKAVRAPISHVKFVAAGGVNEQNLGDFLNAGYTAAAVSGRLTDSAVIEAGDFDEITRRARAFCEFC